MLTVEKLKSMADGSVFASGEVENSPEGIYMTEEHIGRMLLWVAKRGNGYYDWCIYIHWADRGLPFVITNGDKVSDPKNIRKLVPCDEEAFKLYRK